MLPLAHAEAVRLLDSVPAHRRNACWWLVQRNGEPIPGNRGGGLLLLAEIPLTRGFARALRALRLSRFVDALDEVVARYRKQLSTIVPEGEAPLRYP